MTGACGFLGSHLIRSWSGADTLLAGVDDFSRAAAQQRAAAITGLCSDFLRSPVEALDPRWVADFAPTHVIHLAAQVGLVESWQDPTADFRANAQATWHLLSALRNFPTAPVFVYMSSNKVYGSPAQTAHGVDEAQPVKPDSPYALGKAAGELAVMTAHRAGWVHGAVLRCSCLYGPDQAGTESQGWVSHFADRAQRGDAIRIHGSGEQIRDALHVDDWLQAVDAAARNAVGLPEPGLWNIGGGPDNQLSPNMLWERLEALLGRALPPPERTPARPGDQIWYVSDIRRAIAELDWRPQIELDTGLRTLLP